MDGVNWILLAQNKDSLSLVNAVMNLQVPKFADNFLII
jgi:hypothetical protein